MEVLPVNRLFAVLLLTACCLAQSRVAAIPIGDAYGVAAMRVVIATQGNMSEDAGKQKVFDLLQELEAQITSPAEQASFDAILNALTSGNIHLDGRTYFNPGLRPQCRADLKYALKHRDGTTPTACLDTPATPTDKRYHIPDQLPDPK